MSKGPLSCALHLLRKASAMREAQGTTDKELLEHFLGTRNEVAFEKLVYGYAGMVSGVCRRVLGNSHDANDAFQATFLVLLQKAGTIRRRESISQWLYGVAYRTALKARARQKYRSVREIPIDRIAEPGTEEPVAWSELRSVIDEAVRSLPLKYREPVILCYLLGKTYDDAAQLLGCPKGTVPVRLARARAQLRGWLGRRGITLSAALLATMFQETAVAAPPSILTQGTIRLLFGTTSATGHRLADEVLRTMMLHRLINITALVLLGLVTVGAGVLIHHAAAGPENPPPADTVAAPVLDLSAKSERPREEDVEQNWPELLKAKPLELVQGEDAQRREQKVRYNEALVEMQKQFWNYAAAQIDSKAVFEPARRALTAELFLVEKHEMAKVHRRHLAVAELIEEMEMTRYVAGRVKRAQLEEVRDYTFDTKIAWMRALLGSDTPQRK